MRNLVYIFFIFCVVSCSKLDIGRVNKLKINESTLNATQLTSSSQILDINDNGATHYGHCWSKNSLPTLDDYHSQFSSPYKGAEFTSDINNIEYNIPYYIRPYISNSSEIFYGEEDTVIINDLSTVSSIINATQVISETSVLIDASFISINSLKATDCGICWSNTNSPTIDDNVKSLGTLISDYNFIDTLDNLQQEVNYYIKTFVKFNDSTIIYSDESNVYIDDLTIVTGTYSQTGNSVTIIGDITNLGVIAISDHGHCWSYTNPNPTVNDNLISKGPTASTGQFFNSINLISGSPVTYYYRAYAIKENATIVYGTIETFTL